MRAASSNAPLEAKTWALDKSIASELQRLKERDNHTNHKFLAANYAIFIATMVATLWSYHYAETSGLGAWLTVPMTVLAVIIIGGFQHQLGGCIHEGTHYILFADRKKNEIISDWFAAFPIYTSTYAFRLHHLAHHQFVNDPVRDPNFAQAEMSGHWLDFPLTQYELLLGVIRQLNPIRLVKYIMARARYSAIGTDQNPYADKKRMGSPWVVRVGALFAVLMPVVAVTLIMLEDWLLALIAHLTISAAVLGFYALIPDEDYAQSRINPIISHRATAISRMGFMALLYGALTLTCYLTGAPAWGYFGLLWLLPLFTTFPLFMIAREWVQHGNADRGRLTNSRVFFVNPYRELARVPLGHGIPPAASHLLLGAALQAQGSARSAAQRSRIIERTALSFMGCWDEGGPGAPSIVEVLGPRYAMTGQEISVQDETLELADVNDKEGIAKHSEASRQGQPM